MTNYDEIVEISERLEKVRQELVPAGGKADTIEGETLRAFDRVVYRWFNDGDKFSMDEEDYGFVTVKPSVIWLADNGATPEVRKAANEIASTYTDTDEEYEELLLKLAKAVQAIDWSKPTPNNCGDSR